MADVGFFQAPPDPAADPNAFAQQQKIARMLMSKGGQVQQGTMAGGQYVPPSPVSYVNQLASGAAGGMRTNQLADSARASNILNGGTGTGPGMTTPFQQFTGWLNGLGGG